MKLPFIFFMFSLCFYNFDCSWSVFTGDLSFPAQNPASSELGKTLWVFFSSFYFHWDSIIEVSSSSLGDEVLSELFYLSWIWDLIQKYPYCYFFRSFLFMKLCFSKVNLISKTLFDIFFYKKRYWKVIRKVL